MWGNDRKQTPQPSSSRVSGQAGQRAPGESREQAERTRKLEATESTEAAEIHIGVPDVEGMDVVEAMEAEDEGSTGVSIHASGGTAEVDSPVWRRARARRAIREFLWSMPRGEPTEALTFLRPDGEPRTVTRAEISAAVDHMRPRMRRIIRLAVEEHWPRKRVCAHLGISIKTYERDHVEALDALVDL